MSTEEKAVQPQTPNYSTNLAPAYIAEQIFFHLLMHSGDGNPFMRMNSKWFVDNAAPKIRELLTAESTQTPDCWQPIDAEAVNKELLQALETVKTWLSHFTGYGSVVVGGAAEQVVIIDRAIAKARAIRGQ